MEVIFHVRNFGKIKSADVNISNFALFVGNNNSGKTLLMELIYGVLDELKKGNFIQDVFSIICSGIFPQDEKFTSFGLKEIKLLNDIINQYLEQNKSAIIESTFNSDSLSVEHIYLEFVAINCNYQIKWYEDRNDIGEKNADIYSQEEEKYLTIDVTKQIEGKEFILVNRCFPSGGKRQKYSWGIPYALITQIILPDILGLNNGSRTELLFLPAARTGFMMTYRPYFGKNYAQKGVTTPVHDFLLFLQEYAYTATAKKEIDFTKILEFIFEKLIDGKIKEEGDKTSYFPKGTNVPVSLMVASSMVNEIVPITKALTNYCDYSFLFYDEVETSMHPSKQIEMVRLLNRLNNSGMRMIVSTHSDAMARKINNMLLLQHADRPFEEIQSALKEKGITLEKEDLLKGDIHVYQFTNGDDGMSTVEELEFREMPLTGYDFPQFMDSSLNLYEEAKTVMGLD